MPALQFYEFGRESFFVWHAHTTFTFMQIGFDAKRAFQNTTGLGNYARNLLDGLSRYAPEHHYHLFTPRVTDLFDAGAYSNMSVVLPQRFIHRQFPSYWRRKGVTSDLAGRKLDLFHGLSFELPLGFEKLKTPSIVSVHDLIFERYPEQYRPADVYISRKKTKHACNIADGIAAMSEQTRQDLISIYKIPASKIFVTYQSCHDHFHVKQNDQLLVRLKKKYSLPDRYVLSVGSIIERKGLLNICAALKQLQENIPLVVVGQGRGSYAEKVKKFIVTHQLHNQVLLLNEGAAGNDPDFISGKDLPGIYQMATALIYPSLFEGFGIPILEAVSSGIPVVCSGSSSMPEAGGDAAIYVDPTNIDALASAIQQVWSDRALRNELIGRCAQQAAKFSKQKLSSELIALYRSYLKNA